MKPPVVPRDAARHSESPLFRDDVAHHSGTISRGGWCLCWPTHIRSAPFVFSFPICAAVDARFRLPFAVMESRRTHHPNFGIQDVSKFVFLVAASCINRENKGATRAAMAVGDSSHGRRSMIADAERSASLIAWSNTNS